MQNETTNENVARIAKLEAQVALLQKQLNDAKSRSQFLDETGKPHKRMSDDAERMLLVLANSADAWPASQLAGQFGPSRARCELIVDELDRHGFISIPTKMDADRHCRCNAKGRSYLSHVGLI